MKGRTAAKLGALAVSIALLGYAATHLDFASLLDGLAARRASVALHPLAAAIAYVCLYVAVAAASLPGISALGVAGGLLFGAKAGAPLVLLGMTGGATAAMLLARYVLRDVLRRRRPAFAAEADRRIAREGARWLLAARLAPFVPFFAVNLAAGLSQMPVTVFAATTALGAAPLATVYALAGARLASAGRISDGLDAKLAAALIALAALALGPVSTARGARRWARRDVGNARGAAELPSRTNRRSNCGAEGALDTMRKG